MAIRMDANLIAYGEESARPGLSHFFVHGVSPAMRVLERTIADIAPTDIPVLLAGESGTGKEVIALEIHRLSRRSGETFVKCGCAGQTPTSLAARLNCVESSTGSDTSRGGSLYLDEISHLDMACQARLLEMLPDSAGVPSENCLSVRVISTTTRNLDEEMRNGRFREELYYRINGVHLKLPPLRHRKDDIPALFDFFLKKYASLFGRSEPRLSSATTDLLLLHSWPGNVRELENVARKVVALGNEQLAISELTAGDKSKLAEPAPAQLPRNGPIGNRSLKEAAKVASRHAEREMILEELERTHWNRKRTARELQISYKALLYKLKQLGLDGSNGSDKQ